MTAGAAIRLAAGLCAVEADGSRVSLGLALLRALETRLAALGFVEEPAADAYTEENVLAAPDAYCALYVWYLAAEWHLALGEGDRYENARARFEDALAEARAAKRRETCPDARSRWKFQG